MKPLDEMEKDIADAWIMRPVTGTRQKDLADRWGISVRTVQRILRRDHVRQYILDQTRNVASQSFPDVMRNLVKQATQERSVKAIELYLHIIGLLPMRGEDKDGYSL